MSYTAKQEARLQEFDSVSYDQAQELAVELDKTPRSIISKVQSMEIPYIKKAVPARKEAMATKAELVEAIEEALRAKLPGLLSATRVALVELLENVRPDIAV